MTNPEGQGTRLERDLNRWVDASGERASRGDDLFFGRGRWALLRPRENVLYRILRWLYGVTERSPVEEVPLCPGPIDRQRLTDPAGIIVFHCCCRCSSVRIMALDDRGRRWVSTYTHTVFDSRVPRSSVRICRGILLVRNQCHSIRCTGPRKPKSESASAHRSATDPETQQNGVPKASYASLQ